MTNARKAESAALLIAQPFSTLKDPRRVDERTLHPFLNILVIALAGTLSGAVGWEGLAAYGRAKAAWFATFLDMSAGVPSPSTFSRVLSALDRKAFRECFMAWVATLRGELKGEVVALDGKAVRGAFERAARTSPLHMMHVWATEQRLLLGVKSVAGAPGELEAIPELLKLIDLRGAIVTGDANACSSGVAQAVRQAGAHYLLHLKGNRGPLHQHVQRFFEDASAMDFEGIDVSYDRNVTKAHGRQEVRRLWAVEYDGFPVAEGTWPDLRTMVMVERTRTIKGKSETEKHYFLTDMKPQAGKLQSDVRTHWGVENDLHWTLDVAFNEDACRVQNLKGAEVLAMFRRLALILLKRETTEKVGIRIKQQRAGWDNAYLLRVLSGGITES